MVQANAPSKEVLVQALKSTGRDLVEKLRGLSPGAFERGCYENGWNGREVLAHVASIEWTYPRLLDMARSNAGEAAPKTEATRPASSIYSTPTGAPSGKILSYNDRQVEKRAEMSAAELIDEFEQNRKATIFAVEAAEDEIFGKTIRSAGGIEGPLATVIQMVAVLHVQGHVDDIVKVART